MRSRKIAAAFIFVLSIGFTSIFGTAAKASTPATTIAAIEQTAPPKSVEDLDGDTRNQVICLALNIYHEARGSTQADIMAVGQTTKNRTVKRKKTFCDIIWEKGQYVWTKRPISGQMPKDKSTWNEMVANARRIITEDLPDHTMGADSFYSRRISPPAWARRSAIQIPIGGHVYVRMGK
jgi:spore germination cell wall hydrolase CwlJ-like protein